ncbi:DUF5391 family protein [Bacillus licheniformis]|jgi:hypothetical protein|uniref:DUF5391 family protein n=3 Tax=Bacillus licheniformis TaxID=1402 RepID=Q65P61_BACLD|nr:MULTISPECIES: DUF5391 family protein [Bacillus]EQM24995.1 hypothetical protein N399_00885 [Bacillus licheniformis CG-B52]MBJ7887036.1 DUF5391 family protein [Bacillaceae bacterium HSR45]MBY8348829.1 hypothetical protein [Bacillus sp. PCH94]MDP4081962.1 DUF5391 family protein [Bacillota bacterium]AAU21808.1 hypothetical protein BL02697 [Bacillus licheniformis DSM 13 = ATCC 14580]
MKTNRVSVMIWTLISAFLFCSMIVAASLSPLAHSGPHANEFGTLGMWAAIGTVLLFYMLPLAVYMAGFDAMKFVMAVLCGIGLIITLTMSPVFVLIGAIGGNASALLGVAGLCVLLAIVNVIWLVVAFRRTSASASF